MKELRALFKAAGKAIAGASAASQADSIQDAITTAFNYPSAGTQTLTETKEEMQDREDNHRGVNRRNFRFYNGRKKSRECAKEAHLTYQDDYTQVLTSQLGQQGVQSVAVLGTLAQGYSPNPGSSDFKYLLKSPLMSLVPTGEPAQSVTSAKIKTYYSGFSLDSVNLQINFQNMSTVLTEVQMYVVEAKKHIPTTAVAAAGLDTFKFDQDAVDMWSAAQNVEANSQAQQTVATAAAVGTVGTAILEQAGNKPMTYKSFRNYYKCHKAYNFELAGGAAQIVNIEFKTNLIYKFGKDTLKNTGGFAQNSNPEAIPSFDTWRHVCRAGGFEVFCVIKGQVVQNVAGNISYAGAKVACVIERKFRVSALKNREEHYRNQLAQITQLQATTGKTVDAKDAIADVLYAPA